MTKIKGIDISYCQRNVDYDKLKANGVKFAIVRSGYKQKTDDMLYTHLAGCKKAGIPVGIYVYALAKTVNEATDEARHCINAIGGHEITYPVYYDLEDDRLLDGLTTKQRTDSALAFIEEIKRQGFYPGIYANPAWLENHLEKNRLKGIDLWLAAWTENPEKPTKYAYGQQMWQWGLDEIDGVGKVDGNLCYVDYPALIKQKGLNFLNAPAKQTVTDVAGYAEFKPCDKKYRCLGRFVNRRKLASAHSEITGKLTKDAVYHVTTEVYENGMLKWLEIGGLYSMLIDQEGDILFEEVKDGEKSTAGEFKVGDRVKIAGCYAGTATDKVAKYSAMFGAERYITRIVGGAAVFPYQLGFKKDDTSAENTTGFADKNGIININ